MDAEKYNRNIGLLCPTCGGSLFEYEDADTSEVIKCANCEREMTKDELMRENSETISEHTQEIGEQFTKDAAKELREMMKKAFKGNKNIKFK